MTTFNGNIHPFADKFAMLTAEELADLAESISEIGLLNPIVLNSDGDLIDGRNRLAACEIKGVEPVFVVNDGDPVEIVLAANVSRRHLSTGQRAMAIALGLIAAGKREGGRFAYGAVTKAIKAANPNDHSDSDDLGSTSLAVIVRKAAAVADADDVLAEEVLDGETALDAAYATVTNRAEKKAAQPALVSAEAAKILEEAREEAARILAEAREATAIGWAGYVDTLMTPEERASRTAEEMVLAAKIDAEAMRDEHEAALASNRREIYVDLCRSVRHLPTTQANLHIIEQAITEGAVIDTSFRITEADIDAVEAFLPELRRVLFG